MVVMRALGPDTLSAQNKLETMISRANERSLLSGQVEIIECDICKQENGPRAVAFRSRFCLITEISPV